MAQEKKTQQQQSEQQYEDARTTAMMELEATILIQTAKTEKTALTATKKVIEQAFDKYAQKDGKLYHVDLLKNNRYKTLRTKLAEAIATAQLEKIKDITIQLEQVLQDEYLRELYKYEINDLKPKVKKLTKEQLSEALKDAWYGETYVETLKGHAIITEKQMYQAIVLTTQGGATKAEIVEKVKKIHEQNVNRTQNVAQTELSRKRNQAHLQALKDSGVPTVGMKWIATLSERTCQICRAYDGKIYDVKEIPANPAHPRCRCALVSVPEDEKYARRAQQEDGSWKVVNDTEYKKWLIENNYKEND